MNKKITINDIAHELNVSPTAVSFALNDKPGISQKLKSKILKYVEEMDYKPYMTARQNGMYDQSLPLIGIIYASAGGHLIDEIQQGIDSVLIKTKYYELRYMTDTINDLIDEKDKEVFFERLTNSTNIKGIIVIFLNISELIISKLFEKKIPVVVLNNKVDYGMCVYIDNYRAIYSATKSLIDKGHKNIGLMILDPSKEKVWQERFQGYKDALKENKINYNPANIKFLDNYTLKEARIVTKNLLAENPNITAILYGSDLQAYGGLMGIKEMNLKVPQDISIIGFDDMVPNIAMTPSLSSIKQPMKEMGEMGANMLLDYLKGKDDMKHVAVKLDTELNLRESTNFTKK